MSVQSEAALENGLIDTLQKMNYEYVHIEEEKNLSANFKKQLEKHNKKKLGSAVLSGLGDHNIHALRFTCVLIKHCLL